MTVTQGTGTTISGVSTAADVAYGTTYTISVSANTGYDQSTPKLYVNDVETESGTEITVTEDTVIRSDSLNLNTYDVTVTQGTGTTISGVATAADVAYGTTYTVSVSANTGYDQSTPKLYVNDVETESGTEITITENTVIRSDSLNLNTYTVTVTEGTGTTISGVSTAADVAYGTTYTVSVSANSGYDQSTPKLYVNDVETESGTEITITEDTVIRSDSLNLNTYTVTVTEGTGTTISGVSTAADVAYGTTYTVSVSANTGYDQSTPKLYVNDVETESGTEITITENTVIRSEALNLNSYAVTVTPGTGVGISGVETKNYEHGSAVTVTAAAEEGYNDASLKVYVNGEEITNGATITVTGTTVITTSDLSKLTYTVRFYDLDDQLIGEPQTVEYGAAATAPTLPTKADDDAAHGYTVTWDKAFDNVMSALDVYAQADAGTAHTWDVAGTVKAVAYNWTEDHAGCTATISCTGCAIQKTETADQISSNDDPVSTCSTHGTRTFTATFALEGLAPGTATAELEYDYSNHSTSETYTLNKVAPGYTFKGYSGDKYCSVCNHQVEQGQEIEKLNIAENATVISANAILSEEQATPGSYDAAAVSALQTALSELETLVNGDDEQAVHDKLSEIGSKVEALNPLAYVTVIFTVDGNEVDRQTIQSGADATPPTMDEYSFTAGEATHKHFTGWVGSYTAVTEDVTITASYTDEEHTWVDGAIIKQPNCMETGAQNQTCVCGATNVKELPVDQNRHITTDTVLKNAKDPGYTFEGYTGDKHCASCDGIVETGQPINRLTVDGNAAVIAANEILANAENYSESVLAELNTKLQAVNDALAVDNNDPAVITALEALADTVASFNPTGPFIVTFQVDGVTVKTETLSAGASATAPAVNELVNCGLKHKRFTGWSEDFTNVQSNLTVTALYEEETHNWVDGAVFKEADCMSNGLRHLTCVCGATGIGTLPINPEHHSGKNTIAHENMVEPTCSTQGSYDEVVRCECGVELSRTQKKLNTLPHTPGEVVRESPMEATCTEAAGYEEVVYCSVCGQEASRTKHDDGAPLGHLWGEWIVTKEATCTEPGSKTRTCSRDTSHVETVEIPTKEHTDNDHDNVCDNCGATVDTGFRCSWCSINDRWKGTIFVGWVVAFIHMIIHLVESIGHR